MQSLTFLEKLFVYISQMFIPFHHFQPTRGPCIKKKRKIVYDNRLYQAQSEHLETTWGLHPPFCVYSVLNNIIPVLNVFLSNKQHFIILSILNNLSCHSEEIPDVVACQTQQHNVQICQWGKQHEAGSCWDHEGIRTFWHPFVSDHVPQTLTHASKEDVLGGSSGLSWDLCSSAHLPLNTEF